MNKLVLSLVTTVFVSNFALAAEGDSATPPVAEHAIPSAYVWLSGGSIAIGIGYTWGHGTLYYNKDQKQYTFKLSGVSIADVGGAGITARARFTICPVLRNLAATIRRSQPASQLLRAARSPI